MDSNKLIYFAKIAETENMRKAAEELFVSQPNLSKVLNSIEEELGCQLFDRVGKKLVLNDNGRALFEYAKRMNGLLGEIGDRFKSSENSLEKLKIYLIDETFMRFFKDNLTREEIKKFYFESIYSNNLVWEKLLNNQADAIIASRNNKSHNNIDLGSIFLLNNCLVLSVKQGTPMAKHDFIDIKELNNMRMVTTNAITVNYIDEVINRNKIKIIYDEVFEKNIMNAFKYDFEEMYLTTQCMLEQQKPELEALNKSRKFVKVIGYDANIYLWWRKENTQKIAPIIKSIQQYFQVNSRQ